MEHTAGFSGHRAAVHCESGAALTGVAGHALVNQDICFLGGLSVQRGIGAGNRHIIECNGVAALNHDRFGTGSRKNRIGNGDVSGGIDRRRTDTCGVIASFDDCD